MADSRKGIQEKDNQETGGGSSASEKEKASAYDQDRCGTGGRVARGDGHRGRSKDIYAHKAIGELFP